MYDMVIKTGNQYTVAENGQVYVRTCSPRLPSEPNHIFFWGEKTHHFFTIPPPPITTGLSCLIDF